MNALTALLAEEDRIEDEGRLAPDDRLTCHVHRRWIHECVSSPLHVSQVTRHRWCRTCQTAVTVAVDEVTCDVVMRCARCGDGMSPATRRLTGACRASLAAARADTTTLWRHPKAGSSLRRSA